MKKFSAVLLLFALACTSSTAAVKPGAADAVHVSIESRPADSEVYVAGKFIGTTPMVARLAPGDHKIEVRSPEGGTWQRELTVLANSPTRIKAYLPVK
ncbi:MAG TPA: PEGA domain-containing protein [Thermoanaerobaculia bacterium]